MPVPNLLATWNPVAGSLISAIANVKALIVRLETVLTSLDGNTNIGAAAVKLFNLANPKNVQVHHGLIIDATPGGVIAAGAYGGAGYVSDFLTVYVEKACTITSLWARSVSTPGGVRKIGVFLGAAVLPAQEINFQNAEPIAGANLLTGLAVAIPAGTLVKFKTDFAYAAGVFPIQVGFTTLTDHQQP